MSVKVKTNDKKQERVVKAKSCLKVIVEAAGAAAVVVVLLVRLACRQMVR